MDPHLMSLEAGTSVETAICSIDGLWTEEPAPHITFLNLNSKDGIILWPACLN